jgi:uncharacterized protein YbjT (DUF2867 family)
VSTILVTGATGNVGAQVVRELRGRGASMRAFVRDADKAAQLLGEDIDLAVGDFGDPESIRTALDGVDRVFLTSANGLHEVEHENAVIDAAAAAGVRLIVKLSALGAQVGSALPGQDWHGRIEEHLRRSGVPAVILQSNFFMSNLFASADAIKHGKLFAPAGGGKVSMIDPRDIAAVAAVALTTDGHDGQTYVLTGPEAITHDDIVKELSTASGRPVEFVDVPEEAARQAFIEAGLPDWLVTHLIGLFGLIRQGALEQTTDIVRTLTRREPRTFAGFAQDHAMIFTG